MPLLPALDLGKVDDEETHDSDARDNGEDDAAGDLTLPTPDSLASVPISSLYEVTKMRSSPRSHQDDANSASGLVMQPDFIARGVLDSEEAERLATLYLARLDHYFYGHLERYPDLVSIRKTSTMLAVCVCTVGALHDAQGSDSYERLSREFRSVVSSTMFTAQLGLEDIRALCIGSWWLGDMTWMLSGFGIRKAVSLQLHRAHLKQPGPSRDDFIRSQLWLHLYLCDAQISTLHGMPPSVIVKDYVKWEQHMLSPFATDADLRCVSHADLLLIVSRVREVFGTDPTKCVHPSLISQLRYFDAQIDQWGATWSGKLGQSCPFACGFLY